MDQSISSCLTIHMCKSNLSGKRSGRNLNVFPCLLSTDVSIYWPGAPAAMSSILNLKRVVPVLLGGAFVFQFNNKLLQFAQDQMAVAPQDRPQTLGALRNTRQDRRHNWALVVQTENRRTTMRTLNENQVSLDVNHT